MSGDTSRFLAAFPTAPRFHLTGIGDKGVFAGVTLQDGEDLPERVAKVAEAYNKRGNVYFNPNAPADETSPHKLTKGHIGSIRAAWADIDPLDRLEVLASDDPDNPAMNGRAKEKLRLLELAEAVRESDFPPTLAIDSGNGVQLIWALEELVECTDEVREMAEKFGHRIEAALGGTENTANVDRVLRLPGTINKPNAKKRQLGRTEVPARLLYVTGERYDIGELGAMAEAFETAIAPELEEAGLIIRDEPEPEPEASSGPEVEIDPSLPAALLDLLASDAKLRAAWTKGTKLGKGKDKSASGLDMSLTLYLCRKLDPGDLDHALRAYPFGQIGGGTLKGDKAERRIAELLAKAGEARNAAQYENTQDGIAQAFVDTHRGRARYCHTIGKWHILDEAGIWRPDNRKLAFSWVRHVGRSLGFDGKCSTAGGAEKFAQCDPCMATMHEDWDPDPFLLGTPRGAVDLRTGKMRPAKPSDMITRSTGVAPKRGECPMWMAFLNDATRGDKEYQRFLKQISGYSLTGDTREHALFFFYGGGGNGKGVFINTLMGVTGDYAKSAAMETFMASKTDSHPTDLAMLAGARLVTASETEEGRAWAEARIKRLTGGDSIAARFMRQDFFEYWPQFKLLISGNRKPALRSVDDAIRRRFNLLPFVHKPLKPDPLLGEKLKAEWPQILAWAIDGCLDWLENGLVRPKVVLDATAEYFAEEDVFTQWLDECCTLHATFTESPSLVFTSWRRWCEGRGLRYGTDKTFGDNMRRAGFEKRRPPRVNGKRPTEQWHGLMLTAEARANADGGFAPFGDNQPGEGDGEGWSAKI